MKVKDMKQAVELFVNEWNLGEKEGGVSRKLCAWIYLMGNLMMLILEKHNLGDPKEQL